MELRRSVCFPILSVRTSSSIACTYRLDSAQVDMLKTHHSNIPTPTPTPTPSSTSTPTESIKTMFVPIPTPTSPQPSEISKSSSEMSTATVAGISVAGVVGVVAILAAGVFWWRSRKTKNRLRDLETTQMKERNDRIAQDKIVVGGGVELEGSEGYK
ncbi:hypothetical protein BJ508DRAFT_35645 [Ascobolus immersus RN42]|uniref:Mid2 domain-containing protein n=1 Tax=Ascobolus immersus RN42 TaxID=1160509 RepID=A0A3N4HN52_ASCIM|nr:hypothetical protein BJ508DRAFT_35645 [Ascobolus immersus RN42]